MEVCVLCRQPGNKKNFLNNHHVRGISHDKRMVMRVHSKTCHAFANWITQVYAERGLIELLEERSIIYLFHRVATIRDGSTYVLPIF